MKGIPLPGSPAPMHRWRGHGGIELAGDAWGDENGPLVLLLHGLGQTRHAWGATGQLLGAAGFRTVAYDARGHGDSGWAANGDYARDDMIRDLQCLIAEFGGRRPVLVGASMGGATSLTAVGEGHVDATALVLVDIAPRMEPAGVARIRTFMSRSAEGFDTLDDVALAISSYRPGQKRPRKLEGLAKNVRIGLDGKYHWHWDPRLLTRPLESDERRAEAARRLVLPTLLVRGGHSDVVSEDAVQEFLALCPHSEYVNVAGAGHMVAGDRNDTFGRAAPAFVQRTLR